MNRSGQCKAFTLVELLVVIAIIAILAALLLSALATAKHQGQDVKCVSNLKQITVSGLMYMDDYRRTIPEADSNDLDSWVETLTPYGATSNLLLCPVTQVPGQQENLNAYNIGNAGTSWYNWLSGTVAPVNGSYSMNAWLFSYDPSFYDPSWGSTPPQVTGNPQFLFTAPTSVQRQAQTPIFNDAVWWNEWPLEADQPAPDLSQGEAFNVIGMPRCTIWRHGGKTATSPVPVQHQLFPPMSIMPKEAAINIGFDDGHAQMVKLNDLWSLYWHYNWTPSATPP